MWPLYLWSALRLLQREWHREPAVVVPIALRANAYSECSTTAPMGLRPSITRAYSIWYYWKLNHALMMPISEPKRMSNPWYRKSENRVEEMYTAAANWNDSDEL
ncbi:hypothetical protein B0J12DRAFT_703998 [Macrophomina phaseolina]|uniref:Uncharacterized protein n=1 Tax=Macrophomina phaseolina TaxID=35725 RepID=A0ABQ8FWM5_9PEZI|nr:hypothetical protein B0J12DRAFT_703998 [Macrophomina phaseolina]